MLGDPIHGELHSLDASGGVRVPVYKAGSVDAYTLAPNEYVEIHSVELVSAAGGDVALFLGGTNTPSAGEYVVRGTVNANSGLVMSKMHFIGTDGSVPFLIAPAGVVDVNFTGVIRKGHSEGAYPSWQADRKTNGKY